MLINTMLPIQLTEREAEVLSGFMALEGDLSEDPFSTTGRKIVMDRLQIKQAGGLGNFLKKLRDKKFIFYNNKNKLAIAPILIPDSSMQGYQFKLEVDETRGEL